MKLEEIKKTIEDESVGWPIIQDIRTNFDPTLSSVKANSRKEAVGRGIEVVHGLLEKIKSMEPDFSVLSAAHGRGHWLTDYSNSLILFSKLKVDPRHAFVSFVGGSLHDIGCLLVKRYGESKKTIKHAEAGAIFMRSLLPEFVNNSERDAIAYAIAGHTNFKKPMEIEGTDGVNRRIEPYLEVNNNGDVIWSNWFTKAVDRLACLDPVFIGRWYHGANEAKEMQMRDQPFAIGYNNHMRVLLRPEGKQIDETTGAHDRTGLEILHGFVESQNGDSPYSKHDYGEMLRLRDFYKQMNTRTIDTIKDNYPSADPIDVAATREAWTKFLYTRVEPSQKGYQSAMELNKKFGDLNRDTQAAWCHGHQETMKQYKIWAENMQEGLAEVERDHGKKIYEFPMLSKDIREIIDPN